MEKIILYQSIKSSSKKIRCVVVPILLLEYQMAAVWKYLILKVNKETMGPQIHYWKTKNAFFCNSKAPESGFSSQ